MTDYAKQFREHLHASTDGGRLRQWEAFRAFADMGYCALAKPWQAPDRQQAFEDRYMANAKQYTREQLDRFAAMLGNSAMALDDNPADFLGEIYEEEGFCDRKYGGQFFTPQAAADTLARMIIGDGKAGGASPPVITVADPCCGSGRLLLAAARALGDRPAWFDATDVDPTCHHMTYIQMACAGIAGTVSHGNSLTLETFGWAITPAAAMLLAGGGEASEYLRTWLASPSPASTAAVQLSLL